MLKTPFNIICSVLILFSGLAVLLAIQSPASGYEVSIYSSTPIAVWILIIINIITCVVLLVREASQDSSSKRWLFPLTILVVNGIIVLLLSVLRDYYAVGTDTLVHAGYVRDLVEGIMGPRNIYPGIHLFPSLLVLIGLPPITAANLSPVFFYLLYVASFYVLAKVIWGSRREIILTTTMSAILLLPHGVGVSGTLVGASIFPLTLVMILKLHQNFKISYIVAFLVFVALTTLLHPVATEALIIALIIACLVFGHNRIKMVIMTATLLGGVVLMFEVWWSSDMPTYILNDVINSLTIPAILLPTVEGVKSTQVIGDLSPIALILRRYVGEIILGCLASISLLIIAKRYIQGIHRNTLYVYIGSLFVVFNIMWLMEWYLQLEYYGFIFSRMRFIVPSISIILVTPMLARLIDLQRFKRVLLIAVTVAMIVISVGALSNVYPSPFTGLASTQITHQHVKGMAWLVENAKPEVPIIHLNSHRISRFIAEKVGVHRCRHYYWDYWINETPFSEEFSYNDKKSMGQVCSEDIYLVIIKMDKTLQRWERDKLYLIQFDQAATLIYKDGDEVEIWFVERSGEQ